MEKMRQSKQDELTALEKSISALEASIEQVRRTSLEDLGEIPAAGIPITEEEELMLQNQLVTYRRTIEQIGDVNLEADVQYDAVKKRLKFLKEQRNDIVESIGDLKRTITRLDTEARKLFLETFEAAKANFRSVFARLFENGEADLELERPDEPLLSDILIKVRPAGKRQLNLSQLSGGEKALTALALLFALYLVKPSPFCLMDEVDASLDPVNIDRFLGLVESFSKEIQFIIISHNNQTLERAEYLYGVSMEGDGISRVISIRMKDLKFDAA